MQKLLVLTFWSLLLLYGQSLAASTMPVRDVVVSRLRALHIYEQDEILEQLEVLENLPQDSCNAAFAQFFRLRTRFHFFENIAIINELDAIRPKIINCGNTELLYDLDVMMAASYGVSSQLDKLYDLLRHSLSYLDNKEDLIKRMNLMYHSNVFSNYFNTKEVQADILYLLEQKPWTTNHNQLCLAALSNYYRNGDRQKAQDFFRYAYQQLLASDDLVSTFLFVELFIESEVNSGKHPDEMLPYIQTLLQHSASISEYYTAIAHMRIGGIYLTDNQFIEAYNAYKKSSEIIEKHGTNYWKALVHTMMGWAYFSCHPVNNFKQAETHYFKALALAQKPHIEKFIIDKIFKSYKQIGHPDTKKYEIKLAELHIANENTFNNTFNIQELKPYLQIGLKEAKIKELEISNKLEEASLQRIRYIMGFGVLVLGLSFGIYTYYRRNIQALNKLKERRKELNTLNENLVIKNNIIEKQRLQLETLLDKLRESNQSLGSFAQVAAHDVKSPLRTIHSFSSILYQKYNDKVTDEDKNIFNYIIKNCIELQDLVTNLLRFSEVSTNVDEELSDIDLNIILDKIQFSLSQKIETTNSQVFITPDIPTVRGFHSLVELLFSNLLSLSIGQAPTDNSHELKLDWQLLPDDFIQFRMLDNNTSIDREISPNVFDVFNQTDTFIPDDWSICLATCKEIIDKHRCRIWLDTEQINEEDSYIIVYFTLPLKKSAPNN